MRQEIQVFSHSQYFIMTHDSFHNIFFCKLDVSHLFYALTFPGT